MKKVLLGTTALMAGGLVAGAASAADIVPAPVPEPIEEGFTLSINGDATTAFSFRSTDECDAFAGTLVDRNGDGVIGGVTQNPSPGAAVAALETARFAQGLANNLTGVARQNLQLHQANLVAIGTGSGLTYGPCAYKDREHGPNTSGYHDDEPTHIYWDSGLDVTAEITLANGLQVGLYFESDFFDDVNVGDYWVSFAGHWGTVEIGNVDDAYKQSLVWVPGAGGIATVDGMDAQPSLAIGNFPNGPLDSAERGLNLNYFTPRIAGFQFGVSYSPDSDGVDQSDGNNHVLDSDDQYIHNWHVGAHWEHEFANGWGLQIGGGYGHSTAETAQDTLSECLLSHASSVTESDSAEEVFGAFSGDYQCGDVQTWGIGAEVSTGVITVGGGYTHEESDFGKDSFAWAIEGVATIGDWQAGVGYAHEGDNHRYGGFTDRAHVIAAGLAKDIGPGVQVGGFFQWIETREAYHSTYGVGAIDSFTVGTSAVVEF